LSELVNLQEALDEASKSKYEKPLARFSKEGWDFNILVSEGISP
jgi:hypothetical protein